MGKRKCSTNKTTPTKKQEIKNPPEMKTTPFKQRIKLEKKAKQQQLTAAMATLAANHSIEEEELYAIRGGALVPVREQMLTHIRTEFRFNVAIFEILGRNETAALIARLDRNTLCPSSSALTIARMGPRAVEVLSAAVLLRLGSSGISNEFDGVCSLDVAAPLVEGLHGVKVSDLDLDVRSLMNFL
uniref:Uncharacterized protein n=1 Tax=Plectus sambesii TaxID=2011161 RepID=A0A914VYJ6_9BILA